MEAEPAPPPDLPSLPDELVIALAEHALAVHLPSALRLCQTCRGLHKTLDAIRPGAEGDALSSRAARERDADARRSRYPVPGSAARGRGPATPRPRHFGHSHSPRHLHL